MANQVPVYDKKEQLEKLQSACIPGEQVYGAFDMKGGGTGFLGVTSYRIVIYDKAFMRKMKAIVSIPYSRIQAIAAEDESGLLTGRGFFGTSRIAIKAGTEEFEFEFRGADKAHAAHTMILEMMIRSAH
ncbi:MAG: PH domain-containing protein [Thermomicrobiales bacterium]